jgi:hypothetical protein
MLDNPDAVCVVHNQQAGQFAFDMALDIVERQTGKRMGKIEQQALRARFISVNRLRDGDIRLGAARRNSPIYVDNVELVFASLLGAVPDIMTATGTILEGAPE